MAESDIPNFEPMAPPVTIAPPTLRPALTPARPTTWPMVLGTICIVFGVLGALAGVCGVAGQVMQEVFLGSMDQAEESQAMLEAMGRYRVHTIVVQVAAMIVAVVLAIGGIGLTSRRPWSRRVLLHWSWVRMIVAVASLGVQYAAQQAMMQAVAADPEAQMPPQFGFMMSAFGGVMFLLGLAWAWALPIFCLVWLNRAPIRKEMSEWA